MSEQKHKRKTSEDGPPKDDEIKIITPPVPNKGEPVMINSSLLKDILSDYRSGVAFEKDIPKIIKVCLTKPELPEMKFTEEQNLVILRSLMINILGPMFTDLDEGFIQNMKRNPVPESVWTELSSLLPQISLLGPTIRKHLNYCQILLILSLIDAERSDIVLHLISKKEFWNIDSVYETYLFLCLKVSLIKETSLVKELLDKKHNLKYYKIIRKEADDEIKKFI